MLFSIVFGIIFTVTGLISFVGLMIGYIFSQELFILLMAILFLLVFCGIGVPFLVMGIKEYTHRKNIISAGTHTQAKIIDYDDNTTTYVNGVPLLDLIVVFDFYGGQQIAKVATNSSDESKYPINSMVEVSILNNEIVLV